MLAIDPAIGFQPFHGRQIAFGLGLEGRQVSKAVTFMGGVGRIFGLGMSSVKDALAPLPDSETARTYELTAERGDDERLTDSAGLA